MKNYFSYFILLTLGSAAGLIASALTLIFSPIISFFLHYTDLDNNEVSRQCREEKTEH